MTRPLTTTPLLGALAAGFGLIGLAQAQTAPADPVLDPRVAAALARMETQIDSPEPVAATARAVGLSHDHPSH